MSKTVRVTEQRGNSLKGKLLRGSSVVALVTAGISTMVVVPAAEVSVHCRSP